METAEETITGRPFMQLYDLDGSPYYIAGVESAIVNILRSLTQCKLVHCDLHLGNVLCDSDGSSSLIIDFGRYVRLLDDQDAQFKATYYRLTGQPYSDDVPGVIPMVTEITRKYSSGSGIELFDYRETNITIREKICGLIKIMACVEFSYSDQQFDVPIPQMYNILRYLRFGDRNADPSHPIDWRVTAPSWDIPVDNDDVFERIKDSYERAVKSDVKRAMITRDFVEKAIRSSEILYIPIDVAIAKDTFGEKKAYLPYIIDAASMHPLTSGVAAPPAIMGVAATPAITRADTCSVVACNENPFLACCDSLMKGLGLKGGKTRKNNKKTRKTRKNRKNRKNKKRITRK
jgi:serine/threonine protein kinase